MRSPALLCVALCLVTSPLALGEEAAPESKLTPDALVEQLGDASYALREQARQELERREFAATDALKEGLSSPDLEVRYHCERLINDIRERATQRRLDDFVKNPGDCKEYDFPAWKQARDLLGDSEATRQLYVEMYRAESDTLKLVQAGDDGIGSHIDARARFLQRRAQGLYQAPLGNGNIAALLLAAGLQEGKLSPMGHSMVYQLCYQPVFREAMQSDKAAPLKKLLGRYVLTTEDQSAYQGMTLTMQYKMHEEGLACANKILSGKTTAPHIKQYAVLTVAKLGDEKQIDTLKPLLEDKLLCSQMQVDKVIHKTELRDIALFSIVHLSKQDPKKFGFERYTPNDQMVVNVQTLGFPDEEKRQAAFASWKKFEAEQAKK